MSIGIGITTYSRPDQLAATRIAILKYLPPGAKLVVVDDAGVIPALGADYRFAQNAGIAAAKNKCLELLDDCDHIFLFDDDCRPQAPDWWKPYVESPEPHLMYVFPDFVQGHKLNDTAHVYADTKHTAWSHPRGCMLYFDRRCLAAVGGMDVAFGKWGYEHSDLSDRIHRAGLTTFVYQDVCGSSALIYSGDEYRSSATTVTGNERQTCISRNRAIYDGDRPTYIPYRRAVGAEVVLTSYFNSHADPQRGTHWPANTDLLQALMASVAPRKLYVMHDCLDGVSVPAHVELVRCESPLPAGHQRWISYDQFLRGRPDIARVWCVDASDVEMLRDPFDEMRDLLYAGDENETLGCPWMLNHHPHPTVRAFIQNNAAKPLLNSGIIGGEAYRVRAFLRAMLHAWQQLCVESTGVLKPVDSLEMGTFNQVLYSHFAPVLAHGRQVNTVFKRNERTAPSWWKHK